MTKKNCVFLTPTFPCRNGSGLQQRAFAWLLELAHDYNVTLVIARPEASADPVGERLSMQELRPYTTHIETCPTSISPKWLRATALLFPWLPLWKPTLADDWLQQPRAWQPRLPEHIELVFLFRLRTLPTGEFVSRSAGSPAYAIDLDDVESNTLASIGACALRRKQVKFAFHLLAGSLQYRLLERKYLAKASRIYLSNPDDAQALRKRLPGAALSCKPNRIQLPSVATDRRPAAKFSLLFVGTLDYFPNTDAVLWIAEAVVPALRKTMGPHFEVVIVGRGASKALQARLQREPEIRFVGEVASLSSYYSASHAALAAVRCGGGTKLKVLEAVAAHCPVIATRHSARGLPFVAGREFLAADTPDEIAAICMELQQSPSQADEIARRAYSALLNNNLTYAAPHEHH